MCKCTKIFWFVKFYAYFYPLDEIGLFMSNIIKTPPTKESGLYKEGFLHTEGGIAVTVDGVKPIEVEVKEYKLCLNAMDSDKVYSFKNKTNLEILDEMFQDANCIFETDKAKSNEFILCRLSVLDKTKRDRKGTVKQIVNEMQSEKSCNVTFDSNVNKKNKKGGKLEADCGCKHSKMEDGGEIINLAPNGKKSNLNPTQYALVRTKEFKDWFGDWENDPKNASKVLDENGEPLILYHGSNTNFNIFKPSESFGIHGEEDQIEGIYFTSRKEVAEWFASNEKFVKSVFISVKNPLYAKGIKSLRESLGVYYNSEVANKIDGYDGLIIEDGFYTLGLNTSYIVFSPNQIKISNGTNTTFDINSPDIRFGDGGEIVEHQETYKKWKSLVNMSKGELDKFYNSNEGKEAGLTATEAKEKGIDSGRESARWIMKMKSTPVSKWTPEMWRWAKKQISFISRMSGNKGSLYDENGNKTRKHTSLLIWGHNPEKKQNGGELNFENSENNNNFTLNITKDEIQSIISGTSQGFNRSLIESASSYIRGSKKTSGESRKSFTERQQEKLIEFVEKNNLWYSIPIENYFANGIEQKVYLATSGEYVLKANTCFSYDYNWENYFNSLSVHNLLFPQTSYELLGFSRSDKGSLVSVVKQHYVKETSPTDLKDVEKFLSNNGFIRTHPSFHMYENKELGIILGDLHSGNVLTKDDVLYFIDSVIFIKDSNGIFKVGGEIKTFNKLYADHHLVWEQAQQIEDSVCSETCDTHSKEIGLIWESELKPHFKEEEELLFPFIRNAENSLIIDSIIYEHKEISDLAIEIIKNKRESDIRRFCNLLKFHIQKEEALMSKITPDPYKEEIVIPNELLEKGIRVEMEHADTINKVKENPELKVEEVAKMIAADHLKERLDYYDELEKVEGKMKDGGEIDSEKIKISETIEGLEVLMEISDGEEKEKYQEIISEMKNKLESLNSTKQVESINYAYKKDDEVIFYGTGNKLISAKIVAPSVRKDNIQIWLTNKGYIAENELLPKIVSAKKESIGSGYKAFKGLGGGKQYKVEFKDGVNFSSSSEEREDAISDAIKHRLYKVKDYPKSEVVMINEINEAENKKESPQVMTFEEFVSKKPDINSPFYGERGVMYKYGYDKWTDRFYYFKNGRSNSNKISLSEAYKGYVYDATTNDDSKYSNGGEVELELKSILPNNLENFVNEIDILLSNGKTLTNPQVEKVASLHSIEDKNLIKELVELTIVLRAREIATKYSDTKTAYDKIVELYQTQPNLSHRTSESILKQQYSTSAPLAFLMGTYIKTNNTSIKEKESIGMHSEIEYFEPSAGNGLLTIASEPSDFIVNEIDSVRFRNLEYQKYKDVLSVDASVPFKNLENRFDGIITNPPFGATDVPAMFGTFAINSMEQLMALIALQTMHNNGKAAIIIGGHLTYDDKGRVTSGKNRIFYNYLHHHYNVEDCINISGQKLYSRQGTGFAVRAILINGRKSTPEGYAPLLNPNLEATEPMSNKVIQTFSDLYERFEKSL